MHSLRGTLKKGDRGFLLEWSDDTLPIRSEKTGTQAVVLGPAMLRRDDLARTLVDKAGDPASALAELHYKATGFVFVLWEPNIFRLSMGSDSLGLQSLYFHESCKEIAFGARLSDLTPPRGGKKLHLATCEHFSRFLSLPLERTMVGKIRRTHPGTIHSFSSQGEDSHPLFPIHTEKPDNLKEAANRLLKILRDSFRKTLEEFPPKEPVGLLLSGGIDSTALLALLRESWSGPIVGIHIGHEKSPDRKYAREMAAQFGAEFLDIILTAQHARESMAWIVSSMEAPSGNASAVANCKAFATARECGIRRIFSGLGSDEIFCGHTKHLLAPWWPGLALLPQPLRGFAARIACRWDQRILGHALEAEKGGVDMHRSMYASFGSDDSGNLRNTISHMAIGSPFPWKESEEAGFPSDYGGEILQADLNLWLRSALTPMAGALAAANYIELYLPFCAPGVLDLSASLPLSWKVRYFEGKRVLRRAVSGLIPPEILRRPRRGFTVPMNSWLRNDLNEFAEDLLLPSRVERWCIFEPRRLFELLQNHVSENGNWGLPLWAWMTFSVWYERYIENLTQKEKTGPLHG